MLKPTQAAQPCLVTWIQDSIMLAKTETLLLQRQYAEKRNCGSLFQVKRKRLPSGFLKWPKLEPGKGYWSRTLRTPLCSAMAKSPLFRDDYR